MITLAEAGVVHPQAEGCKRPSEAGRCTELIPTSPSPGRVPRSTLCGESGAPGQRTLSSAPSPAVLSAWLHLTRAPMLASPKYRVYDPLTHIPLMFLA